MSTCNNNKKRILSIEIHSFIVFYSTIIMSSKNSFMNLIEKYFKGGELVNEESTNLIHAQCHSIQEEDSEPLKKPSQEVDLASDSHHSFQAISKEVNGQEPTKHSIFEKELSFTVLSRPFTIRLALLITLISTFIMVVARSIDFVLIVRISTQMQNYSVVLSSVLLPILFCVLLWPIVWFKMFVTKSITKEMRKFPLKKVIISNSVDISHSNIFTLMNN